MAKAPNNQEHSSIDQSRPFLGLRSFEEKNKSQFGGRDNEINQLFNLVEDNTLSVVFGTSGIGKTSLLKAGLMPKLRQNFYFPIYIRIDYSSSKPPLQQLKDLVCNEMNDMDPSIKDIGNESIWEYLHDVNFLNGLSTPVIIFDQFEEIFTLGKHNKGIKHFVTELADLAQNRIPKAIKELYKEKRMTVPSKYNKQSYRVVISLREDYLAQLDELKGYIPIIMDHGFRVTQMTIAQAMEAAIKPGKGLIDEAVAKAIIRILPGVSQADFELMKSQGEDNKKLKVEPFLLSLICDRLNEKRIEIGLNTITSDLVAQFKVDDVIKSFYNDTIKNYDSNVDKAIQNELLNSEGYRKLHAKSEFQNDYKISDEIVDALVSARIIRNENRNNVDYLELIHDVLAPIIKKKRDDRLKAELEAKRKAELKKQEEEREAAIQQEKERIKKRNRRRAAIIVPIAALIVIVALISSYIVGINYIRVKNKTESRNLLNKAKSEALFSAAFDTAAIYSSQAYEKFKKYKEPEKGDNLFEPLYYYSLLESYNALINRRRKLNVYEIFKKKNEKENNAPPPVVDFVNEDENISSNVKNNEDPFYSASTLLSNETYYIGTLGGKVLRLKGESKSNYVLDTTNFESPEIKTANFMAINNKKMLAIANSIDFINIYNLNTGKIYKKFNLSNIDGFTNREIIKNIEFISDEKLLVLKKDRSRKNSIVKLDIETEGIIDWDTISNYYLWKWNKQTEVYDYSQIDKDEPKYLKLKDAFLTIPEISPTDGKQIATKEINCFSSFGNSKLVIGLRNGLIFLNGNVCYEVENLIFGNIVSVKFNPTGEYIIMGNDRGQIFAFDLNFDNKKNNINLEQLNFSHSKRITNITFQPDDTSFDTAKFATADQEGLVVNWIKNDDNWSSIPLDYRIFQDSKDITSEYNEVIQMSFAHGGTEIIVFYGDVNNSIISWPASMDVLYNLITTKLEEDRIKKENLNLGKNEKQTN